MSVQKEQTVFPGGASFAFTILDDTDDATVANVKPIYDLLYELGFRTTKTVWPVACPEGSRLFFAGHTLENPEYRAFVQELASRGFEIAFHGATMESSERSRTEQALDRFRNFFGHYPRLHCNHAQNRENLYWGSERYQHLPGRVLRLMEWALGRRVHSAGHKPESPFFWGDWAIRHVEYVRNLAFRRLDVSRIYPGKPYQLRSTPYVKHWFHSADAPDGRAFKNLVTKERVDQLEQRGGYSIVSTHLGKRFVTDGVVDPVVRERLEYIASKSVWLVPASDLLDFLGTGRVNRVRMVGVELHHLLDRLSAKIEKES